MVIILIGSEALSNVVKLYPLVKERLSSDKQISIARNSVKRARHRVFFADSDVNWYGGMLPPDRVHPTAIGT